MRRLTTSDPLICQFAVASLGNNWEHWDDEYPTGNLKDEETQEAKRETLGRPVTDPSAIALLVEALGSPNTCVRRASARMLGQSGTQETVRPLRSALRARDWRVRETAALGLASAEDPGAFHDLAGALKDRSSRSPGWQPMLWERWKTPGR
ncbi:MAG TPA: HEAT repeat domain-containing protein [Gemmatimonadales bacterium]|nr:HEAT repeat domain-containing protein [Gemmatimonadales bacterium]